VTLAADYAAGDKHISFGLYCSLHLCDDKALAGSTTGYAIKLSSKRYSSQFRAHAEKLPFYGISQEQYSIILHQRKGCLMKSRLEVETVRFLD
jgi:hypothetical protein